MAVACSENPSTSSTTRPLSTVEEIGVELPDPAAAGTVVTSPTATLPAGTCTVTITGAMTATWEGLPGSAGATYGPWISAEQQEAGGGSVGAVPDSYFVANCSVSGGRAVTFSANGSIPQHPAVYRFHRGTGSAAGGQSADDLLQVHISTDGGTLWTVAKEGKLTITAFDGKHVAGQFDLDIAPVGDHPATTAHLSGSFDFTNTTG